MPPVRPGAPEWGLGFVTPFCFRSNNLANIKQCAQRTIQIVYVSSHVSVSNRLLGQVPTLLSK